MYKKIIRNDHFLSLLGSFVSALLGFLAFGLIARSLTKDDNGHYLLFLTLFTFLEMLRTGLLNTAMIKHLAGVEDQNRRDSVTAAAWSISIRFTALLVGLSLLFQYFFLDTVHSEGYRIFFRFFGLAYVVSLPFHFSGWYLSANSMFGKLLAVRMINLITYVGAISYGYFHHPNLEYMVYTFIFANIAASIVSIFAGWCRFKTLGKSNKGSRKELLDFGKFSMLTLVGSNLLRSSDTFILEAMLGSRAVSIYTIPQKLVEIIEIPIRSILASALPMLSKLQNEGKNKEFVRSLEQFTGILTLSIIPLCAGLFMFAEPLVVLLGGEAYRDSAIILRILAIYTVFLPFDRFTGVTFDLLNKPIINTMKVFVMLLVNVSGDFLAIRSTGQVWGVATVSIATFLSGVIFGVIILKRYIPFSVRSVLIKGIKDYRLIFRFVGSKVRK